MRRREFLMSSAAAASCAAIEARAYAAADRIVRILGAHGDAPQV